MKNVSSLKSNKIESPKTPGGISKSLLTPCRRVGLSRNWKKAGPSPFVSPITSGNSSCAEVKLEKRETRKRKERIAEEEIDSQNDERPQTPVKKDDILDVDKSCNKNEDIVETPSRRVDIPRRKKSKTVLSPLNNCKNKSTESQSKEVEKQLQSTEGKDFEDVNKTEEHIIVEKTVSTPLRAKSKSKINKNSSPLKNISKASKVDAKHDSFSTDVEIKENINNSEEHKQQGSSTEPKPQSPNELTKECIVVIQKKIFKTDKGDSKIKGSKEVETLNKLDLNTCTTSKNFDSDTDEKPLSHYRKEESVIKKIDPNIITIDEDDDFTESNKVKVKKLEDKNTSTGGLKLSKPKTTKLKLKTKKSAPESKPSSQSSNSFDDDEDFEFINKRTIPIHKAYNKVIKPSKAKSTGSITQRDIDELRARIERKKKLLLAKALTEETEELRGLIKKWQKGCQDALMELMDLMKTKFSDKQNMDYSEMLQMLKIPVNLVGYDSNNDCFNTPDDANIILSKFNDL